MFWADIWKISEFLYLKIFRFLEVKVSIYLNRRVLVMSQNWVGIGSIDCKFNFPNVQLSQSGFVSDMLQSQTSTLCVPSSGQSGFCGRRILHELKPSPCLPISTNNNDSFCPEQDSTISVQNSSYSASLAATNMVLRGTTSTGLSSSSSFSFSISVHTSKRKVSTSKSPSSQPSRLGVIKQSIRDKKISKNVADFVSNFDEHQLRKSLTRNGSFFLPVGVKEGRLIWSRSLLLW